MPSPVAEAGSWVDRWRAGLMAMGLHGVAAALIFAGWHSEPAPGPVLQTLNVQTFTLPAAAEAAPPPVATARPVAPQPISPPPKMQQAELAFEREKSEIKPPEPKPKPRPKPKIQPKPKPQAEPKQEPLESKPVIKQAVISESVGQPGTIPINAATSNAKASAAPGGAANGAELRDYHPIEKIAPAYPRAALRKGLEGDCTVKYTVNPSGRVESPVILGDCHPMFVGPSLRAAKTFRYAPKRLGGVAVPVHNVKNTFEYRIQ